MPAPIARGAAWRRPDAGRASNLTVAIAIWDDGIILRAAAGELDLDWPVWDAFHGAIRAGGATSPEVTVTEDRHGDDGPRMILRTRDRQSLSLSATEWTALQAEIRAGRYADT